MLDDLEIAVKVGYQCKEDSSNASPYPTEYLIEM